MLQKVNRIDELKPCNTKAKKIKKRIAFICNLIQAAGVCTTKLGSKTYNV